MNFGGKGVVGGAYACPQCIGPVPPFNPFIGTVARFRLSIRSSAQSAQFHRFHRSIRTSVPFPWYLSHLHLTKRTSGTTQARQGKHPRRANEFLVGSCTLSILEGKWP